MVKSKKWFEGLARAGYFSRGLVYTIIGLFAILAALGAGENKNTKGALETLLQQPFGTIIVALLIIGLVGYTIWRLVQSLLDTDDHGYSPKGLAVRAGLLSSAATYAILAIYAVSLIGLTSSGSGGGSLAKTWRGLSARSGYPSASPSSLPALPQRTPGRPSKANMPIISRLVTRQ